jgi:Protein kinase domain/SH2 domain
VKVCDFGFSIQLAVRGSWSDAAPRGSPMYMAPECLRGDAFNAASDIYSLGFISWEVLTMGTLFPGVKTEPQLRGAVCDRHERPPLGAELSGGMLKECGARVPIPNESALGRLLRASWASSPLARCSSDTFVSKFDEAAAEYVIGTHDADALKFWLALVGRSRTASGDSGPAFVWWEDFQFELQKSWCARDVDVPVAVWQALRALSEMPCAVPSLLQRQPEKSVSIQKFSELLKWFGPLDSLVERVGKVVVGPSSNGNDVCGFHARLSKEEADEMLMDLTKPLGSFVLRFSSEPGSFGLSCSSESSHAGRKVLHFRVAFDRRSYSFDGREYASLSDFVEAVRVPFNLTTPVQAPPLVPRSEKSTLDSGYEEHMR